MPRRKKCRHRADEEKCLLTFLFIGPWLAILQSLCLSVSRNEWAPSRQGNGTTGRKRNLTVSCEETKHETTSPEQDHSPIASARSNGWAECRDEKSVGTEPTKRNVS